MIEMSKPAWKVKLKEMVEAGMEPDEPEEKPDYTEVIDFVQQVHLQTFRLQPILNALHFDERLNKKGRVACMQA